MATCSRILVWKIPWPERSLAGYSSWGHRVRRDRAEHGIQSSQLDVLTNVKRDA